MNDDQIDDVRWARLGEGRCPQCGYEPLWWEEYPDGGTESMCPKCGYDSHLGGHKPPFIAPGEPGSHDTPEDYPDAGTE